MYCRNCIWKKEECKGSFFCCKQNNHYRLITDLTENATRLLDCMNDEWYCSKDDYCTICNKPKTKTVAAGMVCYKCDDWANKKKKVTMNKQETSRLIEIMQAFVDGKRIQYKGKNEIVWKDCPNPIWDAGCDYCIKPELKDRPLKPEELIELKGKWLKRKSDGLLAQVTAISFITEAVYCFNWYKLYELMLDWTHEDGSPVSKIEG